MFSLSDCVILDAGVHSWGDSVVQHLCGQWAGMSIAQKKGMEDMRLCMSVLGMAEKR